MFYLLSKINKKITHLQYELYRKSPVCVRNIDRLDRRKRESGDRNVKGTTTPASYRPLRVPEELSRAAGASDP